jgi:hypothetical protein
MLGVAKVRNFLCEKLQVCEESTSGSEEEEEEEEDVFDLCRRRE